MDMAQFSKWLSENFRLIPPPERTDENGCECNRCGLVVHYPTKHALVAHGENVLMPVAHGKQDRTDTLGRIA